MAQVGCCYCGFVRQYDADVGGFAGACPECGQRLQPVSTAAARQLLREWDIARRYRRGPSGAGEGGVRDAHGGEGDGPPLAA